MNNKSYRIRTTPGGEDKYITLQLDQKYESFDILSLKIEEKELYKSFNADYGCVIGRVIANGVGIPNAKISIFIPLDSNDEKNEEILALYPYKKVYDKDRNQKKYNLLSRIANLVAGWSYNLLGLGYQPKTPVGSFPSKYEILCDKTYIDVYKKYYRFTTVSNESGDFMLFGVPVGQHTLHMDVDLTDIGRFSMKPVVLSKKLGYPKELFTENNLIKLTDDIESVPSIQSQNIDINVIPFWGNSENTEIGITRQDFKINAELAPSFLVFGSNLTMKKDVWWGDRVIIRMFMGLSYLCFKFQFSFKIFKKRIRIGPIKIKIPVPIIPFIKFDKGKEPGVQGDEYDKLVGGPFDLNAISIRWLGNTEQCTQDVEKTFDEKLETNDGIDLLNHRNGKIYLKVFSYPDGTDVNDISSVDDVKNVIKFVEKEEYIEYVDDGVFALILFCNRRKKITNEFGELVDSNNPNEGVYTEFKGYFTAEMRDFITNPPTRNLTNRVKMKIPQTIDLYETISNNTINLNWYKEAYTFTFNNIYSVSQLYGDKTNANYSKPGFFKSIEYYSIDAGNDAKWDNNTGHIRNVLPGGMKGNWKPNLQHDVDEIVFGDEWMHFCLYFLQFMYKTKRSKIDVSEAITHPKRIKPNKDPIGGNIVNSEEFNIGSMHQTDFVHIPTLDFQKFAEFNSKGFTSGEIISSKGNLIGTSYKKLGYGNSPYANNYFFYKGFDNADCFKYIIDKNLV